MQLQEEFVQLQQDFLQNQGKKGFRFQDNSENYPALVTKYNEKIKPDMSDTDKFALLYTLLNGERENSIIDIW